MLTERYPLALDRIGPDTLSRGSVSRLYSVWTGDDLRELKQAERLAWAVEDVVASGEVAQHGRLGSESDIASRFGTGMGVAKEALELLNLSGVCTIRRGPGGGVFVRNASLEMTAQALGNHFLRTGITPLEIAAAKAVSKGLSDAHPANPVGRLLAECVAYLERTFSADTADGVVVHMPRLVWCNHEDAPLSVAKQVSLAIAHEFAGADQRYGYRLGSEDDLCARYGISRISMRQTIRLLEYVGLVESRPGRGRGLTYRAPDPNRMIRRLCSYFSSLRLTDKDCRAAAIILGSESLAGVIRAQSLCRSYKLRRRTSRELRAGILSADAARRTLRDMISSAQNPIVSLFWKGVVGYAYRNFDEDDVSAVSGSGSVQETVDTIVEAALDHDASAAAGIYRTTLSLQDPWHRPARFVPTKAVGAMPGLKPPGIGRLN